MSYLFYLNRLYGSHDLTSKTKQREGREKQTWLYKAPGPSLLLSNLDQQVVFVVVGIDKKQGKEANGNENGSIFTLASLTKHWQVLICTLLLPLVAQGQKKS